ncbi:MAG: SCP2 sterol-binding domain-containing protein [Oscillospiraceae bacterium]|nr:SCP2 sterol-binding domain-containing protein [Oscillospiraceae bacterium]
MAKNEIKDAAVKTEKPVAPVAEVKAAPEAPKAEAVKPAAPKAEKKAPAAKKPAAPKTEKKAPAKKAAAPKAEKKAPAKKAPSKKAISYDSVVTAAVKKFTAANISKIKYPIAANIEISGKAEGIFYVLVSEGKVYVEPYKYDDYDVYFRADAEDILAVIEGKKNIYDALAEGLVKVDGNTKKAILLINAAF